VLDLAGAVSERSRIPTTETSFRRWLGGRKRMRICIEASGLSPRGSPRRRPDLSSPACWPGSSPRDTIHQPSTPRLRTEPWPLSTARHVARAALTQCRCIGPTKVSTMPWPRVP